MGDEHTPSNHRDESAGSVSGSDRPARLKARPGAAERGAVIREEMRALDAAEVLAKYADKLAERSTWHSLDEVAERLGLDADAMRERAAERQAGQADE